MSLMVLMSISELCILAPFPISKHAGKTPNILDWFQSSLEALEALAEIASGL